MKQTGFTLSNMVDTTSSHASGMLLPTEICISTSDGYSEKLEGYIRLHIQKKPRWLPRRVWEAVLRRLIVVEQFGPYIAGARMMRRSETDKAAK